MVVLGYKFWDDGSGYLANKMDIVQSKERNRQKRNSTTDWCY